MDKNTAGQKIRVFAFDSTTNLPKSGDAANITAYISKDFGAVTALGDTSATEDDATNAKGYYLFDITQTETNADDVLISAKSSTSNIVVVGAPARIRTTPAGLGDLLIANSAVAANVTRLLGTAWLTPGTAGTPDVNTKLWNALPTVALPLIPATPGRTLVVDAAGLADANAVKVGPTGTGTAQTAKDLGAINVTNLNTLSGHDPGTTLGTSTLTQTQVTGGAYSVQSASCILGDARVAHLDADVSSRMATFTVPTNFGVLSISGAGKINEVVLVDTTTTNTDMLTQANIRTAVGLASANLDTQLNSINTKTTNLPSDPADASDIAAEFSSLQTHGDANWGAGAVPSVDDIRAGVWADTTTYSGGSKGALLAAAGSASDPLAVLVPGSYTPGTFGFLVGSELPLMETLANSFSTLIGILQTGGAASSFSQGLLSAIQVGRDSQNFEVVIGEDYTIPVVMTPPTDITGWTITFTVKDKDGNPVITKTVGSGITVTHAATGVFEIAVSSSNNDTIGNYKFDVWRTDSGNATQINFGEIVVAEREKV